MEEVFEKMSSCIKKNCPVVLIIGNKTLLDKTIPTDKIFLEIEIGIKDFLKTFI